MLWVMLAYRVPQEPSRHKVAVWREVRRLRAVAVAPGFCALPDSQANRRSLVELAARIEGIEGSAILMQSQLLDHSSNARLESIYNAAISDEYTEFLSECVKYLAELDKEMRIEKFTHAELAEEQQSLERLERWLALIQERDVFRAGGGPNAEQSLKQCCARMEVYADQVFKREESL